MSAFIIRPVRPQDMDALANMVRNLARFHGDTPAVTPAALARDCLGQAPWLQTLVADRQGALCGYAMLCPRAQAQFGARGMDLHHLYVQKALRGQGLGQQLLRAAVALAEAHGARFLTVGTMPENSAAQAFYRQAGFVELAPAAGRFIRNLAAA